MPRPTHRGATYLPALDGLRALAVILVVLYHLHVPGFSSGLLGVGVFFTLSGFLITSLLLATRERTGGFALGRFWLTRARRLLPALLLVLATSIAATAAVMPNKLNEYWWQGVSALAYVNNWHNIASADDYFDRFAGPGPVDHLWSLSIEEQFYLIWPLLLAGLLFVFKRRLFVTLAIIGLALLSFYLLDATAHIGFDNTRAYEGTDTRAGGLLLGAALAFWWPARARTVTHGMRCTIDVAALAGLVVIVSLARNTPDGAITLYQSGIALLSVATIAVLIATVVPETLVATVLALPPLRWIGERSYGIYLWHMPVIAFVPATIRTGYPVANAAIVVAFTVVMSALSWRYVEDPIRRGGLRAALRARPVVRKPMIPRLLDSIIDQLIRLVGLLDRLRARTDRPRALPPAPVSVAAAVAVAATTTATTTDPPAEPAEPAEPAADPGDEPDRDADQPIHVEAALELHATDPADSTAEPAGSSAEHTPPPPRRRRNPMRRRRIPALAVSAGLVATLAVGSLVAVHTLHASPPADDVDIAALADDLPPTPTTVRSGPTLPVEQRRTRCTTVVHIGDSTSIGMNSADTVPDPAARIVGRYRQVGATTVIPDIAGARSSLELVNGEPNAVTAIEGHLAQGQRGCWVMAMGINDTANVEVGGPGPVDMRIDRLLGPLRGQPVLWPTVITSPINENPAYDNRAMRRFNRALVKACARYPNLRIYDWAAEARPDWFSDGIHYTEAGYIQRAYRFAIALATVFPAHDLAPAGCVLRSSDVIAPPPTLSPVGGPPRRGHGADGRNEGEGKGAARRPPRCCEEPRRAAPAEFRKANE